MFTGQIAEASNREDLELLYSIVDEDTGDEVDLSLATVVIEIADDNGCVRFDGSISSGAVTLTDPTTVYILVPRATMVGLHAGTYRVGMTVTNAGITKSMIVGSLAVVNGAVPK